MPAKLLVVDDEEGMSQFLKAALTRKGFDVVCALSAQEAIEQVETTDFECVLTDINMPGMRGLELCERITANRPDIPVIVLTAFGSFESAVTAIRCGAYNFLTKPVEVDALVLALGRAVQHRSLREEVKRLANLLQIQSLDGELIGDSPAIRRTLDIITKAAASDMPTLLQGENGTGKHLVARALHRRGHRKEAPFVVLDLSTIPDTLLEHEIFGQLPGTSPTHTGVLVQAQGGTLLIKEVDRLPLHLQPKLLAVIEAGGCYPIAVGQAPSSGARIITSTSRDLEAAVEQGLLKGSLFFALSVIQIDLPPLRMRANDILLLSQHFLNITAQKLGKAVVGMSKEVAEHLLNYPWPGNVTELKNCIERAVTLTNFERITVNDLQHKISNYTPTQMVIAEEDVSSLASLEEIEKKYILYVLMTVGGNKSLAAQILGLDRKTLYRKLERYGDLHAASKDTDASKS